VAGPNATSAAAKGEASATGQADHPRRCINSRRPGKQGPIPGRIRLVARITHHEVVIRWDSQTTDESASVMSDAKLAEAWRGIVAQHVDVPSMAPVFDVTARSWSD
jgi:hypothetical protein